MIAEVERLRQLSPFEFPALFSLLKPPPLEMLHGPFQGWFVSSAWLRGLEKLPLNIFGLHGWWGKEFDDQGNAINLVQRNGQMERRFPMLLEEGLSFIDHRPGLALHYAPSNPYPWPWIVDELRSLQPGWLLGMSMLNLGPLRRLAIPFVLARWS